MSEKALLEAISAMRETASMRDGYMPRPESEERFNTLCKRLDKAEADLGDIKACLTTARHISKIITVCGVIVGIAFAGWKVLH